jgi:two-component system nitrogen regulation response regulator NtrX
VRELRNVIERLMIMVPAETIEVDDLWFLEGQFEAPLRVHAPSAPARPSSLPGPESIQPLYEARDTWERDYLLKALAAYDGNMSRTADALGVERSNLYRKMRGLGIQTRREEEEPG